MTAHQIGCLNKIYNSLLKKENKKTIDCSIKEHRLVYLYFIL